MLLCCSTLKYWHKVKPCCLTGTPTCSVTEGEDTEWHEAEEDTEEEEEAGTAGEALAFATGRAETLSGCVWMISVIGGVVCSGLLV
jgi:hypothetical protein